MPDIGSNLCLLDPGLDPGILRYRLHRAGRPQESDKGARLSAIIKAPALPLLHETLNEPDDMTDEQEANQPMLTMAASAPRKPGRRERLYIPR
jgi:hypothetical protein